MNFRMDKREWSKTDLNENQNINLNDNIQIINNVHDVTIPKCLKQPTLNQVTALRFFKYTNLVEINFIDGK